MIASTTIRNILNFIIFQVGWLVCILYPGLPAAGLVSLFLVMHFVLVSQQRMSELQFIAVGTVVGAALDLMWFRTGILDDGSGEVLITPAWLIALWAIFMTTLSHSLGWISRKSWLPFVLAPIAGPFTYWSASELGAVSLPQLIPSLVALAVGWLVVFPLLLHLRKSLYPELAQ